MSIMRSVLLAGAESVWLREHAMRAPFVRRSVSRFMPGESMAEALDACRRQQAERGTGTILTHLGENLASIAEAGQVTEHYLQLLDRIQAAGLDAQVSVKLTQLGLDLGPDACAANLQTLVDRAEARGNMIWIDMESSKYVDPTLALFRRVRQRSARDRPVPPGVPPPQRCRSRFAACRWRPLFAWSRAPTGSHPRSRSPRRRTWTRTTSGWPLECSSPTCHEAPCSVWARTTTGSSSG